MEIIFEVRLWKKLKKHTKNTEYIIIKWFKKSNFIEAIVDSWNGFDSVKAIKLEISSAKALRKSIVGWIILIL